MSLLIFTAEGLSTAPLVPRPGPRTAASAKRQAAVALLAGNDAAQPPRLTSTAS